MHAAHEPTASIDPVAQLGDDELIASTQRLLREERKLSAGLLVHSAIARVRNAGNEIYSATEGKNVTAWGGRRNDAAHKPTEFKASAEEVRLMIEGIRQFVARTT